MGTRLNLSLVLAGDKTNNVNTLARELCEDHLLKNSPLLSTKCLNDLLNRTVYRANKRDTRKKALG